MSLVEHGIIKKFESDGNITDYGIVKHDTANNLVILAAANTDKPIGVATALGASTGYVAVDGDPVDVVMSGLAEVVYGGTITRGDFLTCDSSGHAVKITDAMLQAGDVYSIGQAMESGVASDIHSLMINIVRMTRGPVVGGATFTIGTEAANVIQVDIALKGADGVALTESATVMAYLSDDALGVTAGTAHSTSPAIQGGVGLMNIVTTDVAWFLTSEADGTISIDFTDSGTQTVYLNLVLPDGSLVHSGAITHST